MRIAQAKILHKLLLDSHHVYFYLSNPFDALPLPGQFIAVKVGGCFLRRPFSIAGCNEVFPEGKRTRNNDGSVISLLIKNIGKGTDLLCKKDVGDELDILGPLGNPFPMKPAWKKIWLAGGGTGIAPLLFLAGTLKDDRKEVSLFYGARTRRLIFSILLKNVCGPIHCATDDGSHRFKGTLPRLLASHLKKGERPDVLMAGGPEPMLKEITAACRHADIPCYVTVENRMACGTGVCFGCVVKIQNGKNWEYLRVCKDGPVFPGESVVWEDEG